MYTTLRKLRNGELCGTNKTYNNANSIRLYEVCIAV